MFKLFKISGNSLYPFLKDGHRVFCKKVAPHTLLKYKDTIVFQKAPYGLMVKTITTVNTDKYYVQGTSPYSVDSRNFGYIDKKDILYKILFKF